MPVTDEVKKYADTARAQFSEQLTEAQKPLFAVVGAYDAAFEQTRQIPTQVRTLIEVLPEQVKSLRGRVEGTATQLQDQAVTVYGELAQRGERIYAQIRRQPVVEKAADTVEKAVETAETAVETAETAGETVKQGGRDTSAAAKKALAKAADQVEETTDAAAGTAKKATATAANTTKSVADKAKNAADKAVDAAEQATDSAAATAKQNA